MSVSDPVADFLTCVRNAIRAKHRKVDVPASRSKTELAKRAAARAATSTTSR